MFGLTGLRLGALFGVVAIFGIVLGWGMRVDYLRAGWKAKFGTLAVQADKVRQAASKASDNPGLTWLDTAGQIEQIGASRKAWKATSELQTARIDELGIETARLKALNDDLRRKADAQIVRRQKAIDRLQQGSVTPGERSDLARQIKDAEAALDLVYAEGL